MATLNKHSRSQAMYSLALKLKPSR